MDSAENAPLAKKIWGFPWTSSVYFGPNFISISKQDWVSWDHLRNPLVQMIESHLKKGEPLLLKTQIRNSNVEPSADSDLVRKIKKVLDQEIRPAVAMDGGDVVFHSLSNGTLRLEMKGACAGCPSSMYTLKEGIEVRLSELFPEIKEVVSVN